MSIFEYDKEKEERLLREAEYEYGVEQCLSIIKEITKGNTIEATAAKLNIPIEEVTRIANQI